MNLLLDTHVLLWWLDDNPNLANTAKHAVSNKANLVFISSVVIWEIRIKQSLGKLNIPPDFWSVYKDQPFEWLDITADHAFAVGDLPILHRDPFDRMLIAQAKIENLTLVTHDSQIKRYDVPIIEA